MCNINDKIKATSYILATLKRIVEKRIAEAKRKKENAESLSTLLAFLNQIDLGNIKSEQIGEIYNLLYCICIASFSKEDIDTEKADTEKSMFQIFDNFYVSDDKDLIENDLQTNNFYLFLKSNVQIESSVQSILDKAINTFCDVLAFSRKTLMDLFQRIKSLGTYVSASNYYGRLQTNASELKKDYQVLFA